MDCILTSTLCFSLVLVFMIHEARATLNTIVSEDGDVYDCVDMYKQPSLDHPLLRNHTIQLKPSFVLDDFSNYNESDHQNLYPNLELRNGGCPDGSVPILRNKDSNVTRIRSNLMKYPSSTDPNSQDRPHWHFAHGKIGIPLSGARGMVNVFSPSVSQQQHSDSVVYVSHGISNSYNAIQAGWSVFPAIYGDNRARVHTEWTADNYKATGCVNIRCKGCQAS